jgi:hypothetical protein
MNIIKGIHRMAIVLAAIAIVPGFLAGWNIYKSERTVQLKTPAGPILTPEEYVKERERESTPKHKPRNLIEEIEPDPLGILKYHERIKYYRHPPVWQCAIAGVAGSSITFLIVFLGINGTARVLLWIIEGFKEEKKAKY